MGNYLAIDRDQVALASCDPAGAARAFHLFERGSSGWRRIGAVDALDSVYSDRLGPVALSSGRLLIGAPAHDASGMDAGAAYLVELDGSDSGSPAQTGD
jgi:hypothetical protein